MIAPEVTFHRAHEWSPLESRARALVPEVTLRIERDREEIWDTYQPLHNLGTGDTAFDKAFYVEGEPAGLLPIVIGPATRRALRAASDAELRLEIRDGITTLRDGRFGELDEARHRSVHQALAEDHVALLDRWQSALREAGAEPGAAWPLTGTLPSLAGILAILVSWTKPGDPGYDWLRGENAMFTHVRGEHEGRAPWSLRACRDGDPGAVRLAGRAFVLSGQPPAALEVLAPLIAATDVHALAGGKRLAVTLRRLPTADKLRAAVQLLTLCRGGVTSPYR